MTTGEENLGFDSPLKVGMQNIKRSKEKKKKKQQKKNKNTLPQGILIFLSTFLQAFGPPCGAPPTCCRIPCRVG